MRFPVLFRPPPEFDAADPDTWPRIDGRLEYVAGRIVFMPPCGVIQQEVSADIVTLLVTWARSQPSFVVGCNEAGMLLGGDVRAADAAVWRRAEAGPPAHHFRRSAPVLAVEVAGRDEGEPELRDKAGWYLDHGVEVVWLVLPDTREVVVVTAAGETRHARGTELPEHPALPGLRPAVAALFVQQDGGR
jgi:Uma2 family endonuclease